MPPLAEHQSAEFTKLLLMGDSGTGKTGSLVSLVKAGYKLRILDFDNGLDVLKKLVAKFCPDKAGNVEYRTLDDKINMGPAGPTVTPFAFAECLRMLNRWEYVHNGQKVDLGVPATWGKDCILVIDSLTFLADAAYNWALAMNPKTNKGKDWDGRMIYFFAQDAIEKSILVNIKSDAFKTNVIVIAHVKYMERPDGTTKGYPTAVGSALSPQIPPYFNSTIQMQTKAGGARTILTAPSAMIDLKNPAFLTSEMPIDSGLAEFFKQVRS